MQQIEKVSHGVGTVMILEFKSHSKSFKEPLVELLNKEYRKFGPDLSRVNNEWRALSLRPRDNFKIRLGTHWLKLFCHGCLGIDDYDRNDLVMDSHSLRT